MLQAEGPHLLRGPRQRLGHRSRCPRPRRRCSPWRSTTPGSAPARRRRGRRRTTRSARRPDEAHRCAVPRPQRARRAPGWCCRPGRGPAASSVSSSMSSSKHAARGGRLRPQRGQRRTSTHAKSPEPSWSGAQRQGAECAQALGRLPWFAPFFLRARRLRPVLPMRSSYVSRSGSFPRSRGSSSQVRRDITKSGADRPADQSRGEISICTCLIDSCTRWRSPSGATSEQDRATSDFTVRSRS